MAAFLFQHPIPYSQGRERIFESVFLSLASSTLPTPLATSSSSFVVPPSQPSQTPAPSHGYNTRHHPNVALSWAPISLAPSPAAIFARESRADTDSDRIQGWCKIVRRNTRPIDYYLFCLRTYIIPEKKKGRARRNLDSCDLSDDSKVQAFVKSLNSIISHSLPDPAWNKLVYEAFLELCGTAVGLPGDDDGGDDDYTVLYDEEGNDTMSRDEDVYHGMRLNQQSFVTETDCDGDIVVDDDGVAIGNLRDIDRIDEFGVYRQRAEEKAKKKRKKHLEAKSREKARKKFLDIWAAIQRLCVGGGGRRGERVFAEAHFAMVWETPSKVGDDLNYWVELVLGHLVLDVFFSSKSANCPKGWAGRLEKLSPGAMELDVAARVGEDDIEQRKEDLESWKRIAIVRLGQLRVSELFDSIVEWPESLGGVEDLRSYIISPQTRLQLTTTFTSALATRLQHQAAATSDILPAYISLIRALTILHPRGVLLDRASSGIRRYLRERDDAVRVIVRGIMSESLPERSEDTEDLSELAQELGKGIPATQQGGGLEELDYDDLCWAPDPVDAGPEFQRSKGLDVIGSLISLWDTSVLSSRLLGSDEWLFEKEIRTIELLKLRFGEATMQGCDVMLKDIADSMRSDGQIRAKEHIKIEGFPGDGFQVPVEIREPQERYERGFETVKKKRKLTWLQTMGTVEVELELEDRVVQVLDATTWQAAVIHQFHEEEQSNKSTIPRLATT
ncbi:hypothetical protein L873DRAFT_1849147 [Choiromyces venosus 120613-1]|uniref:Cullin family profile domain-containing protein n=1 Tax=Choiromyces venosus 120613-1 TaxID=1336337 RepID=A0A3N4IUE9_9PEZI|nr:hypothetical protein L873DRAFT_1849147 [Choiromyces venosus 120613-1]